MTQRPTDAQFAELKRKRDEAMRAEAQRICEEQGWDLKKTAFHASHTDGCYCACPDGPCQHIWNDPIHEEELMSSTTCSRCGAVSAYHDMRCMP